MSFRKEKKYKLTIFEYNIFKKYLIRNGMSALFKPRHIKSTYYDTESLEMFYNSEEGVLPRKKIRIRSYNNNDYASIEIKISSIEGRHKNVIKSGIKSPIGFPKTIQDQQYGLLSPSLFISYDREYYSFKGLRLTFDSYIKYKNMRQLNMLELNEPERVIEVKASINTPDEFIETVIPFPNTRFSKYCRGLSLSLGLI